MDDPKTSTILISSLLSKLKSILKKEGFNLKFKEPLGLAPTGISVTHSLLCSTKHPIVPGYKEVSGVLSRLSPALPGRVERKRRGGLK